LDTAIGKLFADTSSFDVFSKTMLGPAPTSAQVTALRLDLSNWYTPFHTIVKPAAERVQLQSRAELFGTKLLPAQKAALFEYMKSLW
jgi:hypothetical protein